MGNENRPNLVIQINQLTFVPQIQIFMINKYRPRIIDIELSKRLKSIGAIVLEGAKWCGKSTTAEYHSNSAIFWMILANALNI